MALITFSNPDFKDKTVYAVAGSHTQTILKIAKDNHIPINLDCEDGECGNCLIRVSSVDKDKHRERMASPLTDKEVTVLRSLGKLTKKQVEEMAVNDMPTEWRLACQMIARDEDVLVEFDMV